jgi:hypothetical protein
VNGSANNHEDFPGNQRKTRSLQINYPSRCHLQNITLMSAAAFSLEREGAAIQIIYQLAKDEHAARSTFLGCFFFAWKLIVRELRLVARETFRPFLWNRSLVFAAVLPVRSQRTAALRRVCVVSNVERADYCRLHSAGKFVLVVPSPLRPVCFQWTLRDLYFCADGS